MHFIIENFQVIRKAELDFDGICLLTGTTQSGKTAIFRALLCLTQNPLGSNAYIHHDAEFLRITCQWDDQEVEYYRDRKSNCSYTVNGTVYKKAGKQSVYDFCPNFPIVLRDEKKNLLNFHTEWDFLFPFTKTPAEIFRLFEIVFGFFDGAAVMKLIKDDMEDYKKQYGLNESVIKSTETLLQRTVTIDSVDEEKIKLVSSKVDQLTQEVALYNQAVKRVELLQSYLAIQLPIAIDVGNVLAEAVTCHNATAKSGNLAYLCSIPLPQAPVDEVDLNFFTHYDRGLMLAKVSNLTLPTLPVIEEFEPVFNSFLTVRSLLTDLKAYSSSEKETVQSLEAVKLELAQFTFCPLCEQPRN